MQFPGSLGKGLPVLVQTCSCHGGEAAVLYMGGEDCAIFTAVSQPTAISEQWTIVVWRWIAPLLFSLLRPPAFRLARRFNMPGVGTGDFCLFFLISWARTGTLLCNSPISGKGLPAVVQTYFMCDGCTILYGERGLQ